MPDLTGLLEPEAQNCDQAALVSVAISLKRIADALCDTHPYTNPISLAIMNGLANGAQEWIGHMARNGR